MKIIEVFHIQRPEAEGEALEAFKDVMCFGSVTVKETSIKLDYKKVEALGLTNFKTNEALEEAYVKTQNIDTYWKEGERSSMIGDIMKVSEGDLTEFFIVATMGFEVLGKDVAERHNFTKEGWA